MSQSKVHSGGPESRLTLLWSLPLEDPELRPKSLPTESPLIMLLDAQGCRCNSRRPDTKPKPCSEDPELRPKSKPIDTTQKVP